MSGFFLIRCRARHDSCDGRLLRNVGQSSEISMNVRSKQTNNKKQQQKSPKTKTTQNTKPNNHPKTIEINCGETVKRETYRLQTLKATLMCPSSAKSPLLLPAHTSRSTSSYSGSTAIGSVSLAGLTTLVASWLDMPQISSE